MPAGSTVYTCAPVAPPVQVRPRSSSHTTSPDVCAVVETAHELMKCSFVSAVEPNVSA